MELTERFPPAGEDETWLTPLDWAGEPQMDDWADIAADDVEPEHPFPYPSGLP